MTVSSAPRRRATRAASNAVLPPPYTATRPVSARCSPDGDAAQEADGVEHAAGVLVGDVDPLGEVGTDRDEHRVEAALRPLGLEVLDAVALLEAHAERRDPVDLGVQDVAGQPVGGDAVAHHPAGLGAVVADDDVVAEPGQVVRGRQPARAGADDEHAACRSRSGGASKAQPRSIARSPR